MQPIDKHFGDTARPSGTPNALRERLGAAQRALGRGLTELFLGDRGLDPGLIEDLETLLLSADIGIDSTKFLIHEISLGLSRKQFVDARAAYALLRQRIEAIVQPCMRPTAANGARCKTFYCINDWR